MKRVLIGSLVASLAAVASPASAQVYPERVVVRNGARTVTGSTAYQRRGDNRAEQTERTTKTFKLGANGSLVLGNIAGDITVTRGTGSDTVVEIVKTARGRDDNEARAMLPLVTVEATERSGRADVKAVYPSGEENRRSNRRNVNVSVAYTVTTPAGTRVSVDSISGDVRVTDIKGDLSISTISGDVRIGSAGRVSAAKTISGTVEIADATVDGPLTASSVSGDVILRRVSAQRIDAGSVSGNVRLEDVQCERVEASSTSSDIWFSGPLAKGGRYRLKGFSGNVRVQVTGDTGFEVDAMTFSGRIDAGAFNITRQGRISGRELHGTHGDGSAVLDLQTFSGSIILSKK